MDLEAEGDQITEEIIEDPEADRTPDPLLGKNIISLDNLLMKNLLDLLLEIKAAEDVDMKGKDLELDLLPIPPDPEVEIGEIEEDLEDPEADQEVK